MDIHSHNLALVVEFMARRCLPIDLDNGSNPLARVWVAYALTDPLLFLATLNFAAVHYDIMRGEYNSPITLKHKVEMIRLINARLEDPKASLTNETIGSVAMLAAVESMNENCKELRVHMDALVKMVKMRGGLQELGWSGVLHMFICWQDLTSSAMMASPPHFTRTPYYQTLDCDLPFPSTLAAVPSTLNRSAQLCEEMTAIFRNIRHLTATLTSCDHNISTNDLMSTHKMRSTLEHWLLSLKIRKPPEQMTMLNYQLEAYRLAALIFLECVLHTVRPVCATLRNMKKQLMTLIREGEDSFIEDVGLSLRLGRGSMTWIMFMGGILSLNEEEKTFFAERIAILVKTWHSPGP